MNETTEPPGGMKRLTITWERIGRNRNVLPFTADFDPDDERSIDFLCRSIDNAIRRHVNSRTFAWSMDVDGGPITIDGGRFGNGVGVVEPIKVTS